MNIKKVHFQDLGIIDYQAAYDLQGLLFSKKVDAKLHNRTNPTQTLTIENNLLFCEHPHVYTLGKSGKIEHLLLSKEGLELAKATFIHIDRGGDITYHGYGQLVGYPILDLEQFEPDIIRYMTALEEVIIKTIAHYGLIGTRLDDNRGVWIDAKHHAKARKIAAFGVKTSRWISKHGWGLNVNTNLTYFNNIIPCGLTDKGVTSIQKELDGQTIDLQDVKKWLRYHFEEVFDCQLQL